jgi:hypothetical protein
LASKSPAFNRRSDSNPFFPSHVVGAFAIVDAVAFAPLLPLNDFITIIPVAEDIIICRRVTHASKVVFLVEEEDDEKEADDLVAAAFTTTAALYIQKDPARHSRQSVFLRVGQSGEMI